MYWPLQGTSAGGAVVACNASGCGGTPTAIASPVSPIGALALDASSIYWPQGDHNDDGQIAVCSKTGCAGEPQTVLPVYAWVVAVDATNVYWSTPGTNRSINQAPK